jgi:hypothetical protein
MQRGRGVKSCRRTGQAVLLYELTVSQFVQEVVRLRGLRHCARVYSCSVWLGSPRVPGALAPARTLFLASVLPSTSTILVIK